MSDQTQVQRKDAGKPRYDLLPPEFFIERLACTDDDFEGDSNDFVEEVVQLCKFINRDVCSGSLFTCFDQDEVDGVCRVLEFGATKYAAHLWEQNPMTYSRVYRSALSHALKELRNPGSCDDESGLPHVDHFRCNILFLVTYELRGLGQQFDDRPSNIAVGVDFDSEDDDDDSYCFGEGEDDEPFIPEVGDVVKLLSSEDEADEEAVDQVGTIVQINYDTEACRYLFDTGDDCFVINVDSEWELV